MNKTKYKIIILCIVIVCSTAKQANANQDSYSVKEMLQNTQYQLLSAQKDIENLYEKNYELESKIKQKDALIYSLQTQNNQLVESLQEDNSTPKNQQGQNY